MYWILFLGLAFAWGLQYFLIHQWWRKGLQVKLAFRDRYIYEGDTSILKEIVVNDKWLPLPALEVRIAMSANLEFTGAAAENSGVTDQTYKRDIFSFLFHQKVTRSLTFAGKKRGYYTVRQADIKAYDFFYNHLGYESFSEDAVLYVYPAQVDTRRLDIICTAISGTVLVQNQLFPDPFEFSGIREYQPTDPMNRLNWKASMRTGTLLVNQFDSTTNLDLALIFDLEDSHIWKEEPLVEETIRIVSSLAARLVKARMPVELFSNAAVISEHERDEREKGKNKKDVTHKITLQMRLPANAGHMEKLNRQLACIDGYTMPCTALLEERKTDSRKEQLQVLVSKNTDAEIVDAVRTLATAQTPVFWIIPQKYQPEKPPVPIPHVRTFIWEVKL